MRKLRGVEVRICQGAAAGGGPRCRDARPSLLSQGRASSGKGLGYGCHQGASRRLTGDNRPDRISGMRAIACTGPRMTETAAPCLSTPIRASGRTCGLSIAFTCRTSIVAGWATAATTAKPHLIRLPDGSPGRLGPALGAGVVRWRAGPARYRRRGHGGAARSPGGRRSGPALGRTGDLVPAPAAEATTGLP